MLFSLVSFSLMLSMVLGNGVVMTEHIDSGLSYEQCVNDSLRLQDIADDELASGELASGNYNIITAKTFCVWDREKLHE